MYDILDSRILDRNAEYFNVNMENLMENAGKAVANFAAELGNNFLVLCGSGNNGGDGYVAAKYLKSMGKKVDIKIISQPETPLSIKKKSECDSMGIDRYTGDKYQEYDVLIDALLGIGIRGIPREPYYSEIIKINKSGSIVVSVDVPSGFPSEHRVIPNYTVTMQFIKKGMNKENCGTIKIADVGFPEEVIKSIGPGEILAYPRNLPESHKGDNGILLALAGSREYHGSAIYLVKSALRMGTDLVFLYTPESAAHRISSNVYDIIIRESGFDYFEVTPHLLEMIENRNVALAIGPGLSKNPIAMENAEMAIRKSIEYNRKFVLDADPLLLSKKFNHGNLSVLTPHHGEFRNAFELDPNEQNARKIAKDLNTVILLKGHVDIITDGYRVKLNKEFHHESMTRGGTGDILTGAIGGLISKGVDTYHAACLGSYVIGKSGLLTFKKYGYSYYTSEILNTIPEVMNEK